ncbi:MAG: hypothetical protein E5W81_27175, partial [Mesorhizobium sp.]
MQFFRCIVSVGWEPQVAGERVAVAQPGTAEAERLTNQHKQLIADESIQFDLPAYVPPKPPEWLKPLQDFLSWLGPYMIYLFWGAV